MIRVLLAAFLLATGMLAFMSINSEAREQFDRVRVVYMKPTKSEHEQLLLGLQNDNTLTRMRELLSPLRLPHTLTLKLKECGGDLNAWYQDNIITICYDYLAFILKNAESPPEQLGLTRKSAFVGALVDLILHEVGHAVFDMLNIPLFGREESAADMFSAYIMLQFSPRDAHQLINATAYLSGTEARRDQKLMPTASDYANTHGLPAQRYFNLLCIAYGSNPKIFTIGKLPNDRAEGCEDEYNQVRHAFAVLIEPHLDQNVLKNITARKWFDFEDAAQPSSSASARANPHNEEP